MTHDNAAIAQWIIGEGLQGSSLATLLEGLSERLSDAGVPLSRSYVALPTVHPMFRVIGCAWRRETGTTMDAISHERGTEAFQESPFGFMLRNGLERRRWALDRPGGAEGLTILEELGAAGSTDYFACLVPFRNPDAPSLEGIAMSFTTERPGGFSDADIAAIEGVVAPLSLAAYRIALFDVAAQMLDTYVGLSAGRRVLRGEIQRGRGQTIYAALFFADLRGFTRLADSTPPEKLIGILDDHFDAMAEPVVARGGDVLKFMGDGLLAVFPIGEERSADDACAAAVDAAVEALARNADVNQAQPDDAGLSLDVALHLGEIFYGNVGSARRLDFTVVGPAVNELSRIETLCGALDTPLLLSAPFAQTCGRPVRSLGRHRLRGVAEERELFTLN